MNVVVCGGGYVGLVVAVRAAQVGHKVICVETDPAKRDKLNHFESYIEDVSSADLCHLMLDKRLGVIGPEDLDQIHGFDVGIIAVPTPLKDGIPDLSYVESAARMLGKNLTRGACVVLESTTYPGTTEGLVLEILEQESNFRQKSGDFELGFSPERIDPGNKEHTFVNTPKLVSGVDEGSLAFIMKFYSRLVDTVVPVSSPKVAEITKLWENIYAEVNIALINEMATICGDLDIDVWEMIDAAQTKGHSMGDFPWKPGLGTSGHCLPIDPQYLSWLMGGRFEFANLSRNINAGMPNYVIDRCQQLLGDRGLSLYSAVHRANVLVIGVTYKPGSADMRESTSMKLVDKLRKMNVNVRVSDPHVKGWVGAPLVAPNDIIEHAADLVIVATAHPEYDYEKLAASGKLVFDCRNVVPAGKNVVRL